MEGIVSLLDAAHDRQVRALCAELAEALGLGPEALPPFPHFSYQIAPRYAPPGVAEALGAVARAQPPLTVTTAGVAVFPGAAPVVYVPLVRTAALTALHAQVWAALRPLAVDPPAYYYPDQWVPHITLVQAGVDAAGAAEAVRRLNAHALYWSMPIETLCFAGTEGTGAAEVVRHRFALGGG